MHQMMDACSLCDGVWLDRGELARIHGLSVDLLSGEAHADPQGAAECPDCKTPMETRWFSRGRKVLLDVCPSCGGIWLDSEELRSILQEVYALKERATVLVAPRGNSYHARDCRLLKESAREMSYAEAMRKGRKPCKVCRPPAPEQLSKLAETLV